MNGSTDFSADAAARSLLSRTSTFVSKPVPVPRGGAVDPSTLDPAALINSVAHETRFAIESAADFNARWRAALRERFEAQGVVDELDAWLDTGLSNGRPLRLAVMALQPNFCFPVHAHPNIEFQQTLAGSFHEVRLRGDPPTLPGGDEGPDLRRALDWEAGTVPAGGFVVNPTGSVHQSFTEGDGALIVVLWSGCHANVRPEKCPAASDLLRPGAGWAD